MGHPRFFDFHCDTITREKGATPDVSDFFLHPGSGVSLTDNGFHIDLNRLPRQWDWAQVFAVFVPDEFRGQAAVDYFERCAAAFGAELERQNAAIAAQRRSQVGSGDRSERIRTYNFPQGRVTDHRLTGDNKNFAIDSVLNGGLDPIIDALTTAEQAAKLAEAGE